MITKKNKKLKFEFMKKLEWTTEKRKVNDLLPFEINPRKISEKKKQKMIQSIKKFNLAEIPAINLDNTIIAGHQRVEALQIIGRGEEAIDVRVPSRQLNKKELKEYNLISNSHFGEWNIEILEAHFEETILQEWNIEIPEFKMISLNYDKEKKDLSNKIQSKFVVEVSCVNEKEQEKLYNELLKQGYSCRLLTL